MTNENENKPGSVRGSRANSTLKTDVPSVAFAVPDVKTPLNGHIPGQVRILHLSIIKGIIMSCKIY